MPRILLFVMYGGVTVLNCNKALSIRLTELFTDFLHIHVAKIWTGTCSSLKQSLQLSVSCEDGIGFGDERIQVCQASENSKL
ncbi:hypothetical protein BT93_H1844 [Corymbia citriodora subsp. variegata]|nr:hypothetical protein BT93_H1844 [Corymbia citriodora subsp. variegata]